MTLVVEIGAGAEELCDTLVAGADELCGALVAGAELAGAVEAGFCEVVGYGQRLAFWRMKELTEGTGAEAPPYRGGPGIVYVDTV